MTDRSNGPTIPRVREFALEAVYPELAPEQHQDRALGREFATSRAPHARPAHPLAGRGTRSVDLREIGYQTRDVRDFGLQTREHASGHDERADDDLDDEDIKIACGLVTRTWPHDRPPHQMTPEEDRDHADRTRRIERLAEAYRDDTDEDETIAIARMVSDLGPDVSDDEDDSDPGE